MMLKDRPRKKVLKPSGLHAMCAARCRRKFPRSAHSSFRLFFPERIWQLSRPKVEGDSPSRFQFFVVLFSSSRSRRSVEGALTLFE